MDWGTEEDGGGDNSYLAYEEVEPAPKRRRRTVVAGGVVVLTAAGALTAALLSSPSHKAMTLSIDPGAFVMAAAQQTLAEKGADVALSGSMSVAGLTVQVGGSGQMDFARGAADLSLNIGAGGHSIVEEVRNVSHTIYMSITIDGTNSVLQQTGTADWIELPIAQSLSGGSVGTNPVDTLTLLEKQGATVERLGTRVVDGVECFGFSATPSAAVMAQQEKVAAGSLGLTPAQQAQILGRVQMKPPTITLWIDQNEVLRQMTEALQMSTGGNNLSGNVVFDFHNYGATVTISSPPSSQVIPFATYITEFGSQGTSG